MEQKDILKKLDENYINKIPTEIWDFIEKNKDDQYTFFYDDNIELLNLMFIVSYTLVKENICEYNIKEAISIAQKAQDLGRFDFENEKLELENILKNIQGSN